MLKEDRSACTEKSLSEKGGNIVLAAAACRSGRHADCHMAARDDAAVVSTGFHRGTGGGQVVCRTVDEQVHIRRDQGEPRATLDGLPLLVRRQCNAGANRNPAR